MAIALVQRANAKGDAVTSLAPTWAGATTTGNLLILAFSTNEVVNDTTAVTPPSGYVLLGEGQNDRFTHVWIYFNENATSESGSKTISWTGAGDAVAFLSEWSGANADANDLTANTSGNSLSASTGTLGSEPASDSLRIGVLGSVNTPTHASPTNSFTNDANDFSVGTTSATNANKLRASVVYRIGNGSAEECSVTISGGTNRRWSGVIGSFKAAAGAAATSLIWAPTPTINRL